LLLKVHGHNSYFTCCGYYDSCGIMVMLAIH
jgi:hypothetical protein